MRLLGEQHSEKEPAGEPYDECDEGDGRDHAHAFAPRFNVGHGDTRPFVLKAW